MFSEPYDLTIMRGGLMISESKNFLMFCARHSEDTKEKDIDMTTWGSGADDANYEIGQDLVCQSYLSHY